MGNAIIAIGAAVAALAGAVTLAIRTPVGLCADPGYSSPTTSIALPICAGVNLPFSP